MAQYKITDTPLLQHNTQAYAFCLPEGFSLKDLSVDLEKEFFPGLGNFLKDKKITGKKGQMFSLPVATKKGVKYLFFVGLGKKTTDSATRECLREAMARIVRLAESAKVTQVALELPVLKDLGLTPEVAGQLMVTAMEMAGYIFDEFITDKDAKKISVEQVIVVTPKSTVAGLKDGVEKGMVIAQAINRARHWIDLPANKLAPVDVAQRAQKLAKEHGLKITVFNEDQVEKMGMGGLKAVGMGSKHDCQLVIVEYKTKTKNAPTVALVGKGITFDSGGLNLKPTGYIETMKEDMSGAAAVLNAIAVLAAFKADVNVVALAPLAENMIGGSANHPGDILTFYNGKTTIVGNTDAEGRLVLADALAYADKNYKPDAMVDVATLTGAASHAVGPFFSGLLTQNEELATQLQAAAQTSGDALWRLPLIDEYKVMVKGDIADLCNDGKTKYYAGPTNGACFLSNFVGDTPWAHLDIAPAAFDVPDKPYFRSNSATGVGVRLLVDFVLNFKPVTTVEKKEKKSTAKSKKKV